MKLAITYDNGQVFQHFGKTQQFKIYDIQEGKVGPSLVTGTGGQGHLHVVIHHKGHMPRVA